MPQVTIQETDGSTRTLSFEDRRDPNWLKKREEFCANMAAGMPPAESYIAAYHADDTAIIPIRTAMAKAGVLLQDSQIVLRIFTLKQKVARKVVKKYDYTLQKAYEECEEAYQLAFIQGNVPAMTKLIELRAKLAKILAERVDVNHTHTLDQATTDTLLMMKKEIEEKRRRLAKNTTVTVEAADVKQIEAT